MTETEITLGVSPEGDLTFAKDIVRFIPTLPDYIDIQTIPIEQISPSLLNPRTLFDEADIMTLAESIRQHGLMQPLVVRQTEPERYELIAGERRYRAIKILGWQIAQVIVKPDVSDIKLVEMAIVENLIRKDLDPIEEAQGYAKLREFGREVSAIAVAVNRSQPAVSNALRLLRLPEAVRGMIRNKSLTASHGIALVGLAEDEGECIRLAYSAQEFGWTTKHLENIVQATVKSREAEKAPSLPTLAPPQPKEVVSAVVPEPAIPAPDSSTGDEDPETEQTASGLPMEQIEKIAASLRGDEPEPVHETPASSAPVSVPAQVVPAPAPAVAKSTPAPAPASTPAPAAPVPTTPAPAPPATPAPVPVAPVGEFVNMMIPREISDWLIGERLTAKKALLEFREIREYLTPGAIELGSRFSAYLSDREGDLITPSVAIEMALFRRCLELKLIEADENYPGKVKPAEPTF